jgi:hypothetical protein
VLTVETPPDLLLRVAALFHDAEADDAKGDGTFLGHEEVGADIARAALQRLRFSVREIDLVTAWSAFTFVRCSTNRSGRTGRSAAGPRRRAASRAPDGACPRRHRSLCYPEPEKPRSPARLTPSRRSAIEVAVITGEEIMRIRGIPPGPEVGKIKERLDELVLEGEIRPEKQAVIDYLSAHSEL